MEEIFAADETLSQAIRDSCISTTNVDPGLDFALTVEDLGNDGNFRVGTNLQSRHGLSREIEHKVVERAVLAVAGFDQRIDLMSGLEAITGFADQEVPHLERKLTVLASQLNSTTSEMSLSRVIETGEIEVQEPAGPLRVHVDRLLKFRDSAECAELRLWLRQVDKGSATEIKNQFKDLHDRAASAIGSPIGRVVRFLVDGGAAFVPGVGMVLSPLLTLADSFLLEHVVGRPGPATFLGDNYRRLYEK
ncbi:MAG TPA: hypothetical protein VHX87_10170 [Galbitalea sp.]|jgi:hypothetical protein|nr:hypothetical protein [Galbitalea sp.]